VNIKCGGEKKPRNKLFSKSLGRISRKYILSFLKSAYLENIDR